MPVVRWRYKGRAIRPSRWVGTAPRIPTVDTGTVSLKLTPTGVERVAVFPYFPVIDEFNDPSAPRNISIYNSNWTHHTFDGTNELQTTTDGGIAAANLSICSAYRNDIFGPDGEVFATVKVKPADGQWFELLARVQNPGTNFNAYLLVGFANAGTDQIELWWATGGAFFTLAVMQTAEYAVGDEFGIRFIGDQISCYKNGVQIGTTQTDTHVTGPGYIGLRMTSVSNIAQLDNFGGGRSAVAATDANTVPILFTPSALEAREQVDATTVPLLFTPSAVELKARDLTDANIVPLLFTSSAVETAALVDTGTTIFAFTPSAVELKARDLTDTNTAAVLFTVSAVETAAFVDANTVSLIFTSSGIELKARDLTDAVTASILFTPSALEIREISDLATGTLVLTPSGTDTYVPGAFVYTDANIVPLLFTPSAVELKARELTDANTAILLLTVSGSDVAAFVEIAFPQVLDDFNRADAASLGPNWSTDLFGDGRGSGWVNSNSLAPPNGVCNNWWNQQTFGSDVEARMTIATWSAGTASNGPQIALRVTNPGPGNGAVCAFYWFSFITDTGGPQVQIWKRSGGNWIQLLTSGLVSDYQVGDVLIARCIGNNQSAYRMRGGVETLLLSTNDTSITGGGYIGFGIEAFSGAFPRFDDFAGGSIVTAVRLTLTPSGTESQQAGGLTTDAVTVPLLFTETAVETAVLADANTVPLLFTPSAVELKARELTDANTVSLLFTESATETAALVDANTVPLLFTPSAVELKARDLTDTNTIPLLFTPSATEVIERVLVDANTVPLLFTPSGADVFVPGAAITDAATVPLVFTTSAAEIAAFVDTAVAAVLFTISAVELKAIELTDANTVPLLFTPTAAEISAYADTTTTLLTFTPSAVELKALEITDANTVPFKLTASGTDVLIPPGVQVDAATVSVVFTVTTVEIATLTDTATALLVFTPSVVEIRERVDANTVPLLFTPSVVEIRERVDADTTLLLFTVSATQLAALVDANTTPLLFNISAVEVLVPPGIITDANTVPVLFTASAIEVPVFADTNTTLLKLTPSGTDVYIPPAAFADANTALVKFTASGTEVLVPPFVIGDSATAFVRFTPSFVEIAVLTEAATVYLRFYPFGIDVFIPLIPPPAETDLHGILYRAYEAIIGERIYSGVTTRQFVAVCKGLSYEATIPYRRWWVRFDTTSEGYSRAPSRQR